VHLHYEHLRILGEARIAKARPGGSTVAACCLVAAGMAVISMSPLFLLTGLFVGGAVLWIGVGIVGVGAICFIAAWGLHRGYLWGWFGAILLTGFSFALAWWMNQVGSPVLSFLAAVLVFDSLAIQLMLWRRSVRDWCFRSHRVRADRYAGMAVELNGSR